MRLPKLNSLYGQIFTIFWLTMLLVLLAVLALPHLDPRKSHSLPPEHLQQLQEFKSNIEHRFAQEQHLTRIIKQLESPSMRHNDKRPRFFITDSEGTILTTQKYDDFKLNALQNFITGLEPDQEPQQKLYGSYMIAGPLDIQLAQQNLRLYVGLRWHQPPPFLLRLLDQPLHLLLAVMLVSTPLLLWLAWALSVPARRLALAAQRVARGEFKVDPILETGTREFQQAGRSFNQMVEAVNQMISGQQRLLSDISHELRSPLTRLRMANALASRKLGQSNELARIDTEADRLEQMISELLTLSRHQIDGHLTREVQQLSSLWEAILQDAEFEAQQMNKNLSYETIPELAISCNPAQLMSALENVVRNAIYYGKDHILVRFSVTPSQLNVTVEDNGEGVDDSELAAIFRPFYRVSTARDRHSGGTGLGLAITENAIRQHNGTLEASRSELGGLKICFTLPLSVR